jgi:hypothetical protein
MERNLPLSSASASEPSCRWLGNRPSTRFTQTDPHSGILLETLAELRGGLVDAIPKLLTAALFLALAYTGIRVALRLVRSALGHFYSDDLIADLFTTVVAVFL